MALEDSLELAFASAKYVLVPTIAELDLPLNTLLQSVSISAFLEAITNWLYWESGLSYR